MYVSFLIFRQSTLENLQVNRVFGTIQKKLEKNVDCKLFKKVIDLRLWSPGFLS